MLIFATRSQKLFHSEFFRSLARDLIRGIRGPSAVRDSLKRATQAGRLAFFNVVDHNGDTVIVLSGTSALRERIHSKQSGKQIHLLAGPNIIAHPHDAAAIICSHEIDQILVPSEWVRAFWAHEAPEIANKLRVWPAGVEITSASSKNGPPIILAKKSTVEEIELCNNILHDEGFIAHIFNYGHFSHKDYLAALSKAPFLVYLGSSESQGLALQEAWAHDVPTFVRSVKNYSDNGQYWASPNIAAPYLNSACGAFFDSPKELTELTHNLSCYNPKIYCDEELSDIATYKKLLSIINNETHN